MSRTEEDILSRVDVPIMRNTTLSTYPASYSELCDTFRPRLGMARRTDSGRERFIHFLVPGWSSFRSMLRYKATAHGALRDDVQEPMPARITGKVRAVLDLAFGERAGVKHPEGVSRKTERVPLALQISALQGHPAQGAPAPPAQERTVSLPARLGVLLADGVDGARMQAELLAAPRSQAIQIKAARPVFVPLQRLKLSVVAEIPDEIAGARLPAEESGQRLDAVSVHQQHRRKLMPSQTTDNAPKLMQMCIFGNNKSNPQEGHFLSGASAGVSVPESR
jgi:hypothetical protein